MKENAKACSEQEIEKAIRKFQKLFGLKVTGKFDFETSTLMNTPRCGLPDTQKVQISKSIMQICDWLLS